MFKNIVRPSFSDLAAEIQDAETAAQSTDHMHFVFDDDAGSTWQGHLADQDCHLLGLDRVHSAGRFVEQQKFWRPNEGPSQLQATLVHCSVRFWASVSRRLVSPTSSSNRSISSRRRRSLSGRARNNSLRLDTGQAVLCHPDVI